MPELPDLTLYADAFRARIVGRTLERIRVASPFVVRSASPPPSSAEGRSVVDILRIGKQLVWSLEGDIYLVFHLMIAGRFHMKARGTGVRQRHTLAGFDFEDATYLLTEASTKKRASLHVVASRRQLGGFDRGGVEVMSSSSQAFQDALTRENHTLKRALTDPRLFSGIGNSYSDEILHRARLSPLRQTRQLSEIEITSLYRAVQSTMAEWVERLRAQTAGAFPEKVTAFRPDMAVHGRFGRPCPVCGNTVQRIVYAENECNYCPGCQTSGRILADRSLSRLLKDDWPKTIDEL